MDLNPFLLTSLASIFSGALLLLKGGVSNLAKRAMFSKYTWIYGISEFLEVCFVMSLYFYVSATEGALVTRIAVVVSLVSAHIFLRRNMFKREYLGVVPVVLGLYLVFSGIDEHLITVLILSLIVAVFRNLYYFSIELNEVPYETKTLAQNYSVVGYIVSMTGIAVFTFLLLFAGGMEITNTPLPFFPTLGEFYDADMFVMSATFGLTILAATKYLEFQSIQTLKTETFQFVVAFSPITTFLIELGLSLSPYYETNLMLEPSIVFANILIVGGSIYVIFKKYANPLIENQQEVHDTRSLAVSALLFYRDDKQKASEALGISETVLNAILTDEKLEMGIRKDVKDAIERNHHKNIAQADALTGLCNRLQFITCLKCVQSTCLFVYIDLNKFKPINDTYGHEAGDAILIGTANRLETYVAENYVGLVTRLGGDEFALLLEGLELKDSQKVIDELKQLIALPYQLEGIESSVAVGASIGVSSYPEETDNPEDLIFIADKRMYGDKSGR